MQKEQLHLMDSKRQPDSTGEGRQSKNGKKKKDLGDAGIFSQYDHMCIINMISKCNF